MQLNLSMYIKEISADKSCEGDFQIQSEFPKVDRHFLFTFRPSDKDQIFGNGQNAEQLIVLKKDKKIFLRVDGVISENNSPNVTAEQGMILGLFLQILSIARNKMYSDHGIVVINPDTEKQTYARHSRLEAKVNGKASVPDKESQDAVIRACT
ncbi:MAG: hypothetical protein WC575_02955 [Patescibacteria group bacterium]